MNKFIIVALFLAPSAVLACWMVGGPPTVIQNNSIKARITYDKKAMRHARITLQKKKSNMVWRRTSDENGTFIFSHLSPGEYRLTMLKPSHEVFDLVLVEPTVAKTALYINFYADYCYDIRTIADDDAFWPASVPPTKKPLP